MLNQIDIVSGANGGRELPFVDALRGIAILLVVLVHTAQGIPGLSAPSAAISRFGQMGVQLFFLMSAFTLAHSWASRQPRNGRILGFYTRRFFRIAPMYYIGIVIYSLLVLWRGGSVNPTSVLVNFLLLNGLVPSAMNAVVPGGWSIGTEVLFYAIFPLLIAGYCWLETVGLKLVCAIWFIVTLLILVAEVALHHIFGINIANSSPM